MKAGGPEPVHDLQQVVLAGSVDQNWCRRRDLNPDHPLTKRFDDCFRELLCRSHRVALPPQVSRIIVRSVSACFRSSTEPHPTRRRAEAPVRLRAAKRTMTFDAYLDGQLLAQDLLPATVQDLSKLEIVDVEWVIQEHGRCSVLDDNERQLEFVAHGTPMEDKRLTLKR